MWRQDTLNTAAYNWRPQDRIRSRRGFFSKPLARGPLCIAQSAGGVSGRADNNRCGAAPQHTYRGCSRLISAFTSPGGGEVQTRSWECHFASATAQRTVHRIVGRLRLREGEAAGGWRPLVPTPPGGGPSGLRRGTSRCGRLVIISFELAWPLLQLLAIKAPRLAVQTLPNNWLAGRRSLQ